MHMGRNQAFFHIDYRLNSFRRALRSLAASKNYNLLNLYKCFIGHASVLFKSLKIARVESTDLEKNNMQLLISETAH